ncbi:MAG: lamin tail domain-containing protein [Candidatus Staskawiczbacteria bacterium]|nr:lamin tail domain-containing protein [Candidatus Staskawiczbacteria bacterium]
MKFIIFLLIIFLSLGAPIFVFADCNKSGTTVFFVNGMLTFSEADAKKNTEKLEFLYDNYGNDKDVAFTTGYNPSHISGLADMIDASVQAYMGGYLDYDLTNILRQAHTDLKTQKILLVGHSQGTFYTNAAYDYLVNHGVDKNSIAVYNIATPADRVAGNDGYLTSSTDKVVNAIVKNLTALGSARQPLPPNINLKLSKEEDASLIGGHSLSDVYLVQAPDRIVTDMNKRLNGLTATKDKTECFVQPKQDIVYWITNEGYYLADNVKDYGQYCTTGFSPQTMNLVGSLFKGVYNFGQEVGSDIVQIFHRNDFSGASLVSAPVLTSLENSQPQQQTSEEDPPAGEVIGITTDDGGIGGYDVSLVTEQNRQDLLDDIQEKIDIIRQEILTLQQQRNSNSQNQNPDDINLESQNQNQNIPNTFEQNLTLQNNQDDNQSDNQVVNNSAGNTGGGGVSETVYPKILISEVGAAGVSDSKEEFVELYNPNNQEIDLTNWYLQRKTASSSSWSTYVSNNLFSGKKISANGYFLIARTGYFLGLADVFTDNPITSDNSFALKNPSGEISDKLGFGSASDPELLSVQNPGSGQSIGRKTSTDGAEQDTDNNSNDFELQIPTPKAQNITYVPPEPKDTSAPQIIFSLEPAQTETNFSINFTITDPVVGAVSPSGVDSYVFRWQEDGGAWQADELVEVSGNPVSANLAKNFIGQDGKIYNFQLQATDTAGNTSDWLPATPTTTKISLVQKILINEVQIDPIGQRFVELYNPNSTDVDLTGWYLQRKKQNDAS